VTSGKHVDVQMIDGLAAVFAGIDDEPESAAVPRADLSCRAYEARYFIRGAGVRMRSDVRDVPFGQNEHVHRSLRIDIFDRNDAVAAMHYFRRNIARDDFAENAICNHYFGCKYSKAMCVSGLGTNPAIEDFATMGTVV